MCVLLQLVIKGATIARIVSNDSLSAFNSRKRLGYAPSCRVFEIQSLAHVFGRRALRLQRLSKRTRRGANISSSDAILNSEL